jgi:HSP20 family molecular chaperone IbpA
VHKENITRYLIYPKQSDIETARSTYNNCILEVIFDKKKEETKPNSKEIKIE